MFSKSKQLERRTQTTSLGTLPEGLGAVSNCGGPGSNQRRHQPVGQESQGSGSSRTTTPQAYGCSYQVIIRAALSATPTAPTRSTSLGLSRGCLDTATYRRSSAAGVWRELPSLTVWPHSQGFSLEQTEAYASCPAEGRSGHKALEGGALASAQKKAIRERRTVVFVDESGCYLLPAVVHTYSPVGQTPVLKEQFTRDHLSAISGITMKGKLLMRIQDHSFKSPDAIRFLKHLTEHISHRLLVVWDGNPIHRSNEVRDFLGSSEGKGIWLESLPAYAPDLNPDEGIWNYLKRVELRNVVCENMTQLFSQFRKAVQRLRRKRRIIRSCFAQAGLV